MKYQNHILNFEQRDTQTDKQKANMSIIMPLQFFQSWGHKNFMLINGIANMIISCSVQLNMTSFVTKCPGILTLNLSLAFV